MTRSQNIAIAGAGVMGLSAAHALLCHGHTVTLFDPDGLPAASASAMAGGMLAPYSEIEHMPPAWVDAGLEGIRLWQETGTADVTRNGSLLIAHDEDRYILDRFRTHLQEIPACTVVDSAQMQALEPGLAPRFSSGLHIGNEAHLDPRQALARLCATILQKGGTFVQRAAEPQDLADRYNRIIDCRGMGARHADPDLRGVKGEMVVVRNRDFTLRRPVRLMHPRYPLYIVPRADHVFMIGATVIEADDDNRQVSVRAALELLSAAYSLHPGFGEAKIIDIMAGIRPAYADNLPRIKQEGKIISANGLFRHGFLLAPVMARAICDCIEGRENRFISLFTGGHDDRHPQRSKEENRHAA